MPGRNRFISWAKNAGFGSLGLLPDVTPRPGHGGRARLAGPATQARVLGRAALTELGESREFHKGKEEQLSGSSGEFSFSSGGPARGQGGPDARGLACTRGARQMHVEDSLGALRLVLDRLGAPTQSSARGVANPNLVSGNPPGVVAVWRRPAQNNGTVPGPAGHGTLPGAAGAGTQDPPATVCNRCSRTARLGRSRLQGSEAHGFSLCMCLWQEGWGEERVFLVCSREHLQYQGSNPSWPHTPYPEYHLSGPRLLTAPALRTRFCLTDLLSVSLS